MENNGKHNYDTTVTDENIAGENIAGEQTAVDTNEPVVTIESSEKKTKRKNKPKKKITVKQLIIIAVCLALSCTAIIVAGKIATAMLDDEYNPDEKAELSDELNRAKYFVSDWYAELKSDGANCSVFLNELRFNNNTYTLTYSVDRMRAVYPRGVRFFKLEYINKVEFFEVNGKVRCRFYYGNSGEWTFTV